MQKIAAGCVFVVLVFFVLVVSTAVFSYNGLVASSQAVDAQWARVQAAYRSRTDLIPGLVNDAGGAKDVDKATLKAIADARAALDQVRIDPEQAPTDQGRLDKYQAAQAQVSSALAGLLPAVAHRGKDRPAVVIMRLSWSLDDAERKIDDARRKYNEAARVFNTKIGRFPVVLITRPMSFFPKASFQEGGAVSAPAH